MIKTKGKLNLSEEQSKSKPGKQFAGNRDFF